MNVDAKTLNTAAVDEMIIEMPMHFFVPNLSQSSPATRQNRAPGSIYAAKSLEKSILLISRAGITRWDKGGI